MPESLRERQNALTRDLILDTLADIVADEGVHGFSVQQLADRAGVSHRTVYRHFATREALLEALASRVDEAIVERGGTPRPHGPDHLAPAIRTNYRIFEELERDVTAAVVLAMGARLEPPIRRRRSTFFREDLAEAVTHLSEPDAEAVAALLRLLGSSRAWLILTRDLGLDTEAAARVAAWAAGLVVGELADGGAPTDPDTDDTAPTRTI